MPSDLSPFKVRVGEPGQAGNPALVSAYGAGLEGGSTGNMLPLPLVCNDKLYKNSQKNVSLLLAIALGTTQRERM